MNMNKYEGVSDWLKSENIDVSNDIFYRDMALTDARDAKGIVQKRITRACDARKQAIVEKIAKSKGNGLCRVCGRFLEIWLSPENFYTGFGTAPGASGRGKEESDESIAKRVNLRASKAIRRAVNANDFRGMATLTLAPPSPENDKRYITVSYEKQREYDFVRHLFKNFILRVNRRSVEKLRYVAVFELHDSARTSPEKRGTWHIHIAIPADVKSFEAIKSCWGYGIVDLQDFRYDKQGNLRDEEISNPGAYIAEYIGKEGAQFGEASLRFKKRYSQSQSNAKPEKLTIRECNFGEEKGLLTFRRGTYKCMYLKIIEVGGRIGAIANYAREEKK